VYLFRKLLRDAVRGKNRAASPEAWRRWLQQGMPNSYCSGNVLAVSQAPTPEEEVQKRRRIAQQVIEATTASDKLKGEERDCFMKQKLAELEHSMG
jgi:hypothetical protein